MKYIYLTIFYLLVAVVSFFGAYSCQNPKNKYTSPEGYDFGKPDKFTMPSSLLEISGIAFYHHNSDTVYSIQDEDGKLFRQAWDVKKQKNMKFGAKGDYEELAIMAEQVFVLKSNGHIYAFPMSETTKTESKNVKISKHVLPKGEYEGLYADELKSQLYVICKSCAIDKKTKQVTGYVLDYNAGQDSIMLSGSFKLDLNQIKVVNAEAKSSLSPSALTKNPRTGEWYILASANKQLVITDANWKIKEVHKLNSSAFNQPEGIAFDQQLNLFISNEGDEVNEGNILKFKYK